MLCKQYGGLFHLMFRQKMLRILQIHVLSWDTPVSSRAIIGSPREVVEVGSISLQHWFDTAINREV